MDLERLNVYFWNVLKPDVQGPAVVRQLSASLYRHSDDYFTDFASRPSRWLAPFLDATTDRYYVDNGIHTGKSRLHPDPGELLPVAQLRSKGHTAPPYNVYFVSLLSR